MTESLSSVWKKCVVALGSTLPAQHLDTWIKPMKPQRLDQQRLIVEVPSPFFKEWITHHHQPLIEATLEQVLGYKVHLELLAAPTRNDGLSPIFHQPKLATAPDPMILKVEETPKYTFENFVVGSANRFAHAACMAVADAPGRSYNPLFIYGGSGLGKTHLLRAVGHSLLVRTPHTKVLCLTCETFMNEMVASIRGGHEKMVDFRKKFRRADVLLIDDIQFLVGKEGTQEEFFHTFNELYESGRQIIATSDSHPKDISLEDRLRSRFEMGLIADIQVPDYETRVAILSKKADQERIAVSEDILRYLAAHVTSNIRQLEGSLVRLIAISTLSNRPLTAALAEEVTKDLSGRSTPAITVEMIKKATAEYFHMLPVEMNSKRRTKQLAAARQIAMYIAREITTCSLPEIGRSFGGRDHTTVMHACETVKNRLSTEASTARQVQELLERLQLPKHS